MKYFSVFFASRQSIAAAGVCAVLAACSTAPTQPDGAAALRSRLTQLQADSELGTLAPLAIKDAEVAVTAAEQPQKDTALSAHRMVMADRKIEVAKATAQTHYAVNQRKVLDDQRDAMRLNARTMEADSANRRADVAVADASNQKRAADLARVDAANARSDADAARDATATAQRDAMELQQQIDELQAKVTDRGLVLTLGDVLFSSGTADLNSGGNNRLGKLATFMNKYPERTALIEGHTDSMGSDAYNQGLSQRRADAVKSYLVGQTVNSTRLTASGRGESSPVGDNSSATGRQQNRRVEVIIENTLPSSR
jgi:outer membrane protein OmpA-like peptidoglycan-associated protein